MRANGWLPAVAIILTIIGAAFVLGSRMATRDDLAAFRAAVDAEFAEVDAEFAAVDAEFAQIRAELAEIRGYFVSHLEGHAPPGRD